MIFETMELMEDLTYQILMIFSGPTIRWTYYMKQWDFKPVIENIVTGSM